MASTEFATRSNRGAAFLFLMGFALVAAGVGFAFAPHFSWRVAQAAKFASDVGLQSGVLIVCGFIFTGMGIVARGSSSASPVHDDRAEKEALQSELSMLNEQLSTKLAQVRTSLTQMQEGLTAIAAQQQAQLENHVERDTPGDHSSDALFRLAASLDKLHAHFDERVHAVDLQLRSGFEALLNATHDLRRLLGQGTPTESMPMPMAMPSGPAGGGHIGHAQSPSAPGGIDFYETMQKLDAIAGGEESQRVPHSFGSQPQAPFPSQSHGEALDELLPEEYRDRY